MNITLNPDTAWRGDEEVKNYIQAINSRREAYGLNSLDESLKTYAEELDKKDTVLSLIFFPQKRILIS